MPTAPHLVVCIENEGAEDLQVMKVYRRIEDEEAESHGLWRVVDDSGEDYLYPKSSFRPLPLPSNVERELEDVALARARA
jgi:hypothetical protein